MWTFNDVEVIEAPANMYGFIYMITNVVNGKSYIGRKYLTFSKTKQKNKKIKKFRVESDWRDYWSSSPELLKEIETLGRHHFKREILRWCKSRGECNYMELRYQFDLRVLESDKFYNSNIASKYYRKNVIKYDL